LYCSGGGLLAGVIMALPEEAGVNVLVGLVPPCRNGPV